MCQQYYVVNWPKVNVLARKVPHAYVYVYCIYMLCTHVCKLYMCIYRLHVGVVVNIMDHPHELTYVLGGRYIVFISFLTSNIMHGKSSCWKCDLYTLASTYAHNTILYRHVKCGHNTKRVNVPNIIIKDDIYLGLCGNYLCRSIGFCEIYQYTSAKRKIVCIY